MLRWAIQGTVLTLIAAAGTGMGCGSSSNGAGPDASAPDGATDAGTTDGSLEGGDAGPDCGSMPPTGTHVVASTDPLVVFRLTGDGQAVYEDLTTQELYAVAVAGGTPSDIGKMASQGGTVWTHGTSVLYLPLPADPQTSVASLSAWTASAGTHAISTSALALDSYFYTYDASSDGQYAAYFATSGDTATLTVSTIDGKTQTPLVTGIDLSDESCFPPAVQFVNDTLIAQYCQPPGADAGSTETLTVAAFTAPGFTPVTFGTTFLPSQTGPVFSVDPTGKLALLVNPGGSGLSLYPLAGGSPVLVDPKGLNGLFTSNGDILYTTVGGALMRYAAASAMTTTLVPSGLEVPFDVSPDGNWLQAASKQDATSGLASLYLASATTPGSATAIVGTTTTSPQGFTADSKYSVFGTGFPADFGAAAYSLEASPTSGGPATKVLAAAGGALFTTGSKLVCNTNQSKSTGAADIVSLDLSTTAAPTTLVTQADPNLFMTSTGSVLYSFYCAENATAGLWTLTPP